MRLAFVRLQIGNSQWTEGKDRDPCSGTVAEECGPNGLADVRTGFQMGSSQQVLWQARMD